MAQLHTTFLLALAAGLAMPACAAPVEQDRETPPMLEGADGDRPERKVTSNSTSISQRFRTLDEYLGFLESRSASDGHWYREIRPGIYRLETGNYRGVEPDQRVFTREELERQFGFSPD